MELNQIGSFLAKYEPNDYTVALWWGYKWLKVHQGTRMPINRLIKDLELQASRSCADRRTTISCVMHVTARSCKRALISIRRQKSTPDHQNNSIFPALTTSFLWWNYNYNFDLHLQALFSPQYSTANPYGISSGVSMHFVNVMIILSLVVFIKSSGPNEWG